MILRIKYDKGLLREDNGVRQMVIEGRQGNIAVMHKGKLDRQGNIITAKKLEERNIITAKKFKKDVHDINKNIAEVIRDNEELNDTIKKIIENGMKDDDDIVNMLKTMVVEGKERIVKLLNTLRAATAPKRRAEITPIRSGGGECYPTRVFAPRGEDNGEVAFEAEAIFASEHCDLFPKFTTEPTRARRMRE